MITNSQIIQWETEIEHKDSIISDLKKENEALREAIDELAKLSFEPLNHGSCFMADTYKVEVDRILESLRKLDEARQE